MLVISATELRKNFSHYLQDVQQGTEITIKYRNRIVARIILFSPPQDFDEELIELAIEGKATLPIVPVDEAFVEEMLTCELPKVRVKGKKTQNLLQQIIHDERYNR
jgi:prevent-host-death family protein